MYLRPAWTEKENPGRKRVCSDNGETCAPKMCRTRLQSDSGRPILNDVSNNYRAQGSSNQDYRISEDKSNGSSKFTKIPSFALNPDYAVGEGNTQNTHQARLTKETSVSPILSTRFTVAHSHLKNEIKPQKKKTLVKRSTKISKYNENGPYSLNIFTPEYIDDIILNSMMAEHKFKLKMSLFSAHNSCLEKRQRALNWLITIQDDLYITHSMYYSIVYLFDLALSKVSIPSNMYKLVLITIAWLVTKYSGTKMFSASKLVRMCDNEFSQENLLNMECKMLRIFQFNFLTPDPTMFLNYYLYKLNVKSDHQIVFTTYYIMDSFTLSPQYSTYEPSRIAAGALCLCITSLYPGDGIYERIKNVRGYYSPNNLRAVIKVMLAHLRASVSSKIVKIIFSKYGTTDTKFASVRFNQYMA